MTRRPSLTPLCLLLAVTAVDGPARAEDGNPAAVIVLEEEEPQTPYPFLARTMSEQRLGELIFDRFFTKSAGQRAVSRIFREGWMPSAPYLRLILEKGLTFSNGRPASFSDVAFSMNRIYRDPKAGNPSASWYAQVFGDASQSTESAGKIQFLVPLPEENAEAYLTTTALLSQESVPSKDGVPDLAAVKRQPVGTGPFAPTGVIEDFSDITLQRNPHRLTPDGWSPREGQAPVEQLRLLYKQDAARQRELMDGGRAQVWVSPPPDVVPEFQARGQRFRVRNYDLNQWWYVAMDHEDPALSDRRVREALDLLLPRRQLLDKLGGMAELTSGPFVPGSSWVDAAAKPTAEDAERAAALLTEAGYERAGVLWMKGGKPLSLVMGAQADLVDDFYDIVYGVVDAWSNGGVQVQLRPIRDSDWRDVVEAGRARERYDLVLGRWNLDREEAVHAVFREPPKDGRQVNIFGWTDDVADSEEDVEGFLKGYYNTASTPEREALMQKMHQRVHDERPALFLWTLQVRTLYRKDLLAGFKPQPFYFFTQADTLVWKAKDPSP